MLCAPGPRAGALQAGHVGQHHPQANHHGGRGSRLDGRLEHKPLASSMGHFPAQSSESPTEH